MDYHRTNSHSSTRLNRRRFLRTATVLAGSATVLGRRAFAQTPGRVAVPAIDTHIHLFDPAKPGGIPWPSKGDTRLYSPHLPSHFREATGKIEITGAVVIEANARLDDNQWVMDLAKDNPLIVGYIARLSPGKEDFSANFDKYLANPIFRGLRLGQGVVANGLGQAAFEKDIQRMAEKQLTVDVIGGAGMLPAVARLAQFASGLTVVIDHLPFGEWDRDPDAMRRALAPVAGLANVFAKVSNVPRRVEGKVMAEAAFYRPGLDALREVFGNDRILYGSNWPVSDGVASYDQLFHIVADYFEGLDSAIAEKFFWRNSQTAYRWVPRGEAEKLKAK